MKFDHLDLSALRVTYILFHHTPHFLMHHLKPCFSFLEEKVFSILTTLIISFAKAAFHHIPSYKILPSAFPWKISCCYCCLPASVCFSREWNSFLIFFPTSSSSSLPAPRYQLSTLISTDYTSFISILLQNVRSHQRKNGEEKSRIL